MDQNGRSLYQGKSAIVLTPELAINFALSYMNEGKAANCANYFIDKFTVDKTLNPNLTWDTFRKLLEKIFDIKKTADKAQVDLSVLKQKPGESDKYILDFNALANGAGYVITDQENPMLATSFLKGLHPSLCTLEQIKFPRSPGFFDQSLG